MKALLLTVLLCLQLHGADSIPETKHLVYQQCAGLEYWLYQSAAADDTPQPLLIFLHGKGETTMQSLLKWGPPKHIEAGKQFPGIVVTPLSPNGEWWRRERLIVFVDSIAKKYNVDLKRIYLTGLSMGGFASWDLACHYPDRFAALVPICGGGDPSLVEQIKPIPTWVFHGDKDKVVRMEKSDEMVNALKAIGSDVIYTVYPGVGHASWIPAYKDESLYTWIYKQKRQTDAKIDPHAEAKFIMGNGIQLSAGPRLTEDLLAADGVMKLSWHNVSSFPASVRLHLSKHPTLAYEAEQLTFQIAADEHIQHELRFNNLKAQTSYAEPVWLRWDVHYQAPDMEQVQFKQQYAFLVTQQYAIQKQGISVDGQLDDWSDQWQTVRQAKQIFGLKKEERDSHTIDPFRFQIAYDNDYVYVAVQAEDNDLQFLKQKPVWGQDGIEIRLDARRTDSSSCYVDWESFLPILISPQTDGTHVIWQQDRLPTGCLIKTKIGETSYHVEVAIPIDYIHKHAGTDWQRLRLNIAVNDLDAGQDRPIQSWWYPDWRRHSDSRSEGTFVRNK